MNSALPKISSPRLLSGATLALGTLAIGTLCATMPAFAAEGFEPTYTIAYNVGLVSDYRVRGIAQTARKPALQGGIDLTLKSGLYAGVAASNVRWVKELNGATKGSYELDLYGGYRDELMDGLTYDVGAIRYMYPGNNSGVGGVFPAGTFTNASTTEIYGALTYKIYTFKYNRSVTDFLGNVNSKGSQYFDLSAAIGLPNSFTLTPHIGRQLIPNQPGNLGNYTDVALTLGKDFGNGFTASASFQATNADRIFYGDINGKYLGNTTVVLGAKYSF
jgi:uncharacterized protein (TIGR02001 family)